MNKFEHAIKLFDEYNSRDPKFLKIIDREFPANLIYAQRMSEKLDQFEPNATEQLQLAARSQHIGRWEIPRSDFSMDRKGYLKWRSHLKNHHAKLASSILEKVGYDKLMIDEVKNLLVKKHLKQHNQTQTLEDVICLVFLEYYFDDFSKEHNEEKLVNILRKTIAKMSNKGVRAAMKLPLSIKAKDLIGKAGN